MASDHQQQQQQQQQVPTQQQATHLTQTQPQQQSHQLPQTNQSQLSQQQQQLSQSQQSQSQQGSLQQQAQSHHRQQPAAPQHQTSAANSLPQQTELLSHSSTTLDSGRHSGGGGGGSSNATGDPVPHNLSSSDPHQTQQQFCLRWNNFQSNIVNSFETLLDREELVDVTLTAEGRSLRAHRVLLSACSPYFRDLFQDVPPHQHPVIVLRDTRFLELKCLLCFIYHGEVNVSQDNLSCLLNLAENLKVKGLAQEGTKRHNSKEYEYGGRGVLSPDREGDLSDGGEPSNIPRPSRGGHLLRPGRSVSPAPPGVTVPFGNLSALGSLLGNPGLTTSGDGISRSQLDDHVRSRDIRDSHHNNSSSKGSSISLLNASQFSQHERKDQLHVLHQQHHHHHQQQQQQHHSPPSKRRKRHPSPLQHHSPSNTTSSSHHHQQQQQGERFTNNNSGSQLTPPSLPLSTSHNNGGGGGSNPTAHSNSSAHTPSAAADDDGNTHAVNLSVCPSTSPPRLMVPKLELITADDDTSNGEKERLERLEQRERICNFLGKDSIAGMISKFPGGFTDSDMEGEEEPPPPHDEENSADMEGHGPGGGLSHPLSHHLPPGLQQSFVPYPPTTHAAAAAAAAAAHHFANTFTPGPSGVPSSVSPASWRSHASDQNPNSPQGGHPVFNELLCVDGGGNGGSGGGGGGGVPGGGTGAAIVLSKKAVPTPCPICNKVLSNAYNMRVHLETHQDITYKCLICGIVTRTRDTMRKHLSNVHKLRNVQLKNSFKKITGKTSTSPGPHNNTSGDTSSGLCFTPPKCTKSPPPLLTPSQALAVVQSAALKSASSNTAIKLEAAATMSLPLTPLKESKSHLKNALTAGLTSSSSASAPTTTATSTNPCLTLSAGLPPSLTSNTPVSVSTGDPLSIASMTTAAINDVTAAAVAAATAALFPSLVSSAAAAAAEAASQSESSLEAPAGHALDSEVVNSSMNSTTTTTASSSVFASSGLFESGADAINLAAAQGNKLASIVSKLSQKQ